MKTPEMIIHRIVTGNYQVNTYITACPVTRKAAIIDPGGESEKIIRIIRENNFFPQYIINTHGHHDHIQGNETLSGYFNIPVCMHSDDILFFKKTAISGDKKYSGILAVDIELHHNDTLDIGKIPLQVLHTPGHTPGSVCLYTEGTLFSGDTLFVGDAGRTDIPGGNLDTLIGSIQNHLLALPPDTAIYPGHDYGETPYSTLAREIKENIYITDFIDLES